MREKTLQGHGGSTAVVSDSTIQVPTFKESTSQSFDDDENEWELGVGNLIIDLDADLERNSTSPISGQQPETTSTSPKMSHQATVDKGLKMKIKRKSGGAKCETKHEIVKHEKMASIGEAGANAISPIGEKKLSPAECKDKVMKGVRGLHKKDKNKDKLCRPLDQTSNMANGFPLHCGNSNNNDGGNSLLDSDKFPFGLKREPMSGVALDPYEFNAKVEDRISIPVKKIKLEKNDSTAATLSCPGASPIPNQLMTRTLTPFQTAEPQMASSVSLPYHDASTETSHVGTITEPECLGPCEPGTSVSLEGIVWQETENGVLVVNVTWRGKTYVGTLMDSTKHDWAPPRFTCESPTSDFEARTPKGRGKRAARGSASTPLNDMSNYTERKLRKGRRGTNNFQAPPSPAKSDITPVSGVKRKGRPSELDLSLTEETGRSSKRNRSNSRSTPTPAATPTSNVSTVTAMEQTATPGALIQCPEPNCNKKYRHINGLRYHQSHAHVNNTSEDKEDSTKSTSSGDSRPTTPATPAVTANNSDQVNGNKTPIKRTTRESESKSKSRSDSATDKSKDDAKESSVTEEKKAEKCDSNPRVDPVIEVEKKVVAPVTSQVYQISGGAMGRLGGISVLPKPPSELGLTVGVPGTSVTTVTAVTVPIATVATLPVQSKGDIKDDKRKKTDKVDKAKLVKPSTVARPIVPAPMPQTITLQTSNGPITHSTLTAVTAHAQISPTLKGIQPKPTVMGEPSIINPALAALKEKKPKHKKKNKEKERSKSPRELTSDAKDESAIDSKAELKSVIKSVSATLAENRDGAEKDKLKLDAAKLPMLKESDIKTEPGTEQNRAPPPSSLTLNTRLEVSTPDPTDHGSESVQSPAYSDISDAADSASSLDHESDMKQKDKPASNDAPGMPGVEHKSDSSLYGMYPYYGQAPYLIPAIPQTQAQTQPTSASPGPSVASASEQSSKPQENKANTNAPKPGERLEDKDIKKEPLSSPQMGREYRVPTQQQQQKMMPQALYGHPQYQYLNAFGYMDPAYMHTMASDPNHREKHEKFIEEQERLRKEQERDKTGDKDKGNIAPKPPQVEPGKGEKTRPVNAVSPMVTADQNKNLQKLREPKLSQRADSKDKNEKTLKEKQSETLQILKENMDLKPQMDNGPKPASVSQEAYDQQMLLARQREELQRYYMYQQQKLHERHEDGSQRNVGEGPKGDGKKPEGKKMDQGKEGEKVSSRDSPVVKREHSTSSDSSKKDGHPQSDRDRGKSFRDKSDERGRPAERPRTIDDKGRTRSPNVTPKLKTEVVAAAGSPSGGGVIPTHYAQYLPAGYLQTPHGYAQFPYDPSQMYRHGIPIGYPPGPGYPVPAGPPMRYHVPQPMEFDKEKSAALSSPNAQTQLATGEQPKALDLLQQHASHYYSAHKIHELEKARPASSPSSKPPSESPSPTVPTSSYQKPREYRQSPPPQRHVHTHHHTHLVGGYPIPPYDPYSGK